MAGTMNAACVYEYRGYSRAVCHLMRTIAAASRDANSEPRQIGNLESRGWLATLSLG